MSFEACRELWALNQALKLAESFEHWNELWSLQRALISEPSFEACRELCALNQALKLAESFEHWIKLWSLQRALSTEPSFEAFRKLWALKQALKSSEDRQGIQYRSQLIHHPCIFALQFHHLPISKHIQNISTLAFILKTSIIHKKLIQPFNVALPNRFHRALFSQAHFNPTNSSNYKRTIRKSLKEVLQAATVKTGR
jgi:hypothetical protein